MPALADTPYRKCPSTDFLEELDSVLGPQGKGESSVGEWEVEAQSCRSMESTVCLGSKVPSEGDWCRMFVRLQEALESGRELWWWVTSAASCLAGSRAPNVFPRQWRAIEVYEQGNSV